MKNREAIEILKIERDHMTPTLFTERIEAMNIAISALQAQDVPDTNVGDMISRQAAIDALDVLCQEHRYRIPGKRETYSEYNEAWQDALDRAEGEIGNLPSAQPEVIHCRECIHRGGDYCHYDGRSEFVKPDHFCGYGAEEK